MSLSGVAKATLKIIEDGAYRAPSGATVALRERMDRAVQGTRLYRPGEPGVLAPGPERVARIEVTAETTAQAARRLLQDEGAAQVMALNFASAKNPGGGFLGGAKAQEEDLARCSALYPCLLTQRDYYDANRAHDSLLYTDHAIYSPEVPFFRDDRLDLLEAPFFPSILTSPAPNAGEVLRRDAGAGPAIERALRERGAQVLRIAAAQGHDTLVLGAWGCGVFRNDPRLVAGVFADLLAQVPRFARVVFAVYDRSAEGRTLRAFQERFA